MSESQSNKWFTLKKRSKEKLIPIHISTMDSDLEFNMQAKAKGYELFELVCKILGLRESWYFGLRFKDKTGELLWLRLNKKIVEQCPSGPIISTQANPDPMVSYPPNSNGGSVGRLSFELLVKFYPEDVEEIIQTVPTLHLFFLQVCSAILTMEIYCPPEAAVLLASYALQAKYGDFEEQAPKSRSQAIAELPARVMSQYQMTEAMWEERIKTWYTHHKGMSRDEAELEYLKIVQDLDMYGLQYFSIFNKKKTELWLGVTSLGLNIYEKDNKLSPKIFFPWNEIRTVSVDGKKFTIKLLDKSTSGFVFYSHKAQTVKLILELCVGNHDLFLRRRKPDSLEIQQMKIQAREDRLRKQVDRTNYLREQERLEEIAKLKTDLESQLENVTRENERINQALKKSEETTELLAEKSRLAQEESYLLAVKARQAEAEVQRLKNTVLLNLTASGQTYNTGTTQGFAGNYPYANPSSLEGAINFNSSTLNNGPFQMSTLLPHYDSSNTSINSTNSSSSQRNLGSAGPLNPAQVQTQVGTASGLNVQASQPSPTALPAGHVTLQQDRTGWGSTLTNNNNVNTCAALYHSYNLNNNNTKGSSPNFRLTTAYENSKDPYNIAAQRNSYASVFPSPPYDTPNTSLHNMFPPNLPNLSTFKSTYPYLLNSNINEEELAKILTSVKIMSKSGAINNGATPPANGGCMPTGSPPYPLLSVQGEQGGNRNALPQARHNPAHHMNGTSFLTGQSELDEGYGEMNNFAPQIAAAAAAHPPNALTFKGPDQEYEILAGQLEKEKMEYMEKCKTVRDQLNHLRKDFEILKVADKESDMDRIHSDALKRGETKYSTLKRVKVGTMRSRVAYFEEL